MGRGPRTDSASHSSRRSHFTSDGRKLYHGSTRFIKVGDIIKSASDRSMAYATFEFEVAQSFASRELGEKSPGSGGYIYEVEPVNRGNVAERSMPHSAGHEVGEVVSSDGFRVVAVHPIDNDIVENKTKLNKLPKEVLEALSVMKDHDFDLDDSYMVENFTSPTEALACALLVSKGFTGSAQSYLDGTYS